MVIATTILALMAVAALAAFAIRSGRPDPWIWAFVAAIVATEMTELPVATSSGEFKVLLNDALVLIAIAWFSAPEVALLLAVVTATSWMLLPLSSSMRLAHMSSSLMYRCALWGVAAITFASDSSVYASLLAMTVAGIVYDCMLLWPLTRLYIADQTRTWRQYLQHAVPMQVVIAGGCLPLAIIGVAAMETAPWAAPLLAVPLLITWRLALLGSELRDMTASDRMKSRFISMASHELQTPLTSVVGFSATLEDRWDQLDEPQRRRFLHIVHEQGVRLSRLVSQMLVLSRLDADESRPSRPVQVLESVERGLLDSGVDPATVQIDVGEDLYVRASEDDLTRLVVNLLSNADKYGAPPIRVSAYRDSASWITIEVADSGHGIDPGDRMRMFDHFARGADVPSNVAGSGLGLAIARQIARQHGGDLYYDDSAASGACFALRLRRETCDDESSNEADSAPEAWSSASMLTTTSRPSNRSSDTPGSTTGE